MKDNTSLDNGAQGTFDAPVTGLGTAVTPAEQPVDQPGYQQDGYVAQRTYSGRTIAIVASAIVALILLLLVLQ